jgi:2-(3-amino-3-carboxypropyl)histidine synthase
MESVFIEVKYKGEMKFPQELVDTLPTKVVICASVQYLEYLPQLKEFLENNGKEVFLFKSKHGQHEGQVLGCDISKFKVNLNDSKDTKESRESNESKEPESQDDQGYDAFLYLGDGLFHPTALLFNNKRAVYIYNPLSQKIDKLDGNHLEALDKKKMGMLSKFIMAKNVGILVTRKPGQNQSKAVEVFKKEMDDWNQKVISKGDEDKTKNVFVFMGDTINLAGLEDFNFVDIWVNTGCPRIMQDFNCVNLRDLKEIGFFSGKFGVF